MGRKNKIGIILPLYVPWLIAVVFQSDPVLSYWIAWAGSFFIFYRTLGSKKTRFISSDLPIHEQIMRPIFLTQIIFAGFMCCTSVFYFLDHTGYRYLEKISPLDFLANEQTYIIAKCQRLSVLGHAAVASGMIYLIPDRTPLKKYKLNPTVNIDKLLISVTFGSYIAGMLVRFVPAVIQFTLSLTSLAVFCGAFLMVKGVIQKKPNLLPAGGGLFIINFIASSLSGSKEIILVNFIIIGCLIYPFYRKLTLLIGLPVLYGLFYILPTYVGVIRGQMGRGESTAEEAQDLAVETLFDQENEAEIENTNWGFLVSRFSEINMFTQFVESTPDKIDYYGSTIIIQSIEAVVPRVFWPGKPITETLAMERVYNAGVIDRASKASAKTRPIVDAYMSFGAIGVLVFMFLYGIMAQALCNKAESLFGGYQFGCILIFNGMFQPMWRGNTFEFFLNTIFWSFVMMLIVFQVLKARKFLLPVGRTEKYINQKIL